MTVVLLLVVPQDGESKPFFFGFLKKLFGGGKGRGNGGGKVVMILTIIKSYKIFLIEYLIL